MVKDFKSRRVQLLPDVAKWLFFTFAEEFKIPLSFKGFDYQTHNPAPPEVS